MGAPQAAGPSWVSTTFRAFQPGPQKTPGFLIQPVCGGALYLFSETLNTGPDPNTDGSAVFKSTDGGNTWTALDQSNAPVQDEGSMWFDVAGDQMTCGLLHITSPSTLQPLFLQNFNLGTETWGLPFATGGPNGFGSTQFTFLRPDGSIVVIYDRGPSGSGSRLLAAVWSGSWSAPIDVGAGILGADPSGDILVAGCVATMEPATGIIHLAFNNNALTVFMYQQLLADNTLGASHTFAGTNISGNSFRNIIIFGTNLYIAFPSHSFTNNSLLTGVGLTTPVWTQTDPVVLAQPAGFVNRASCLLADSTTLYYMTSFFDLTFGEFIGFKLFTSIDAGVTWVIVPNNATEPFFYDFAPGQSPQAVNADATFGTPTFQLSLIQCAGITTVYAFANTKNSALGVFLNNFINSQAFGAGSTLAISGVASSPTVLGTAYGPSCFPATGGTPPYTFAISSGRLPPGITLNPSTGCLSGKSTAAGFFSFCVTVTDSAAGTATVCSSISVIVDLVIQLIGWKLFPEVCPNDPEPVAPPPHVKQAV